MSGFGVGFRIKGFKVKSVQYHGSGLDPCAKRGQFSGILGSAPALLRGGCSGCM